MTPTIKSAPSLILTMVLSGLALSACSTVSTDTVSPATVSASAPLPVAGYDWHLNEDEGESSLTYGMAETDDAPMDLSCKPGSGQLDIMFSTEAHSPHRLMLESGGDTETYAAKGEPSALTDGLDLMASASSSDPVFKRFRKLGWVAVHTPSGRETFVATSERLTDVDRFFGLCERAG